MPLVYRIRCSNCSQLPDAGGDVAGYIEQDGHSGGILLPYDYLALGLDDGTLACLPHPIEDSVLQAHGFTRESARTQGRLFFVAYKICEACGVLHEEVLIPASKPGCIICLLLVIIAAIVLSVFRFVADWSWGVSLVVSLGMLALSILALVWRDTTWWRKENKDRTIRRCPSCGHDRLLTLAQAKGRTLPCPFCKTHAVVTCECACIHAWAACPRAEPR